MLTRIIKTDSWLCNQFSDLNQFRDLEFHEKRGDWVLLRKDTCTLLKVYNVSFSQTSPKAYMAFNQGNCIVKNKIIRSFRTTDFDLKIIPGDLKQESGPAEQ